MARGILVNILLFFVVLLFLISVIACCTAFIKPAGSMSKNSYKRRGRRRRRSDNEGLAFEETDGFISEDIATVARPSVTVTSQPISASPMVVPPYPVEPLHPLPQTAQVPHTPGFAISNPPYPTQNPHPVAGVPVTAPYSAAPTPYPPTNPPGIGSAPYPDYSGLPPSYSEAVAQPPIQPPLPTKEGYLKQSPYNPNY